MEYRIIDINDISDAEYEYYYSLMSNSKKNKTDKYRFNDDKKRTVAGELLARNMIADYCHIDLSSISFRLNRHGKPYADNLNVEFSISHSDDLVICAVNDKPIGVDIEKTREIDDKVIAYACTDDELAYINDKAIDKKEKLKRFFTIWTFKEAYAKYLGTGITDLKLVSFFDKDINQFNITKEYGEYIISFYTA